MMAENLKYSNWEIQKKMELIKMTWEVGEIPQFMLIGKHKAFL